MADIPPSKVENDLCSTRQILVLFRGQPWGGYWETGRSAYGPFRPLRCHLELKLKLKLVPQHLYEPFKPKPALCFQERTSYVLFRWTSMWQHGVVWWSGHYHRMAQTQTWLSPQKRSLRLVSLVSAHVKPMQVLLDVKSWCEVLLVIKPQAFFVVVCVVIRVIQTWVCKQFVWCCFLFIVINDDYKYDTERYISFFVCLFVFCVCFFFCFLCNLLIAFQTDPIKYANLATCSERSCATVSSQVVWRDSSGINFYRVEIMFNFCLFIEQSHLPVKVLLMSLL